MSHCNDNRSGWESASAPALARPAGLTPLPLGPYDVILADPPWSYKFKSPTGSPRPASCQNAGGAAYYYPTLTIQEIEALPVASIAATSSVLFLWATVPCLPEAFRVMSAWGFKYKTTLTWHKLRCKGMGYWFRGHTEVLLFGVRGNVKAFRSRAHNIIAEKVLDHSRKPEVFRSLIETTCDTAGLHRRVELFARKPTDGWTAWGNEL